MISTDGAVESFACFGSHCTVMVAGDGAAISAGAAAADARDRLLAWHEQFSRFEPESELSRLNADPREEVPVSPVMAALVEAVLTAARATGGLVDATLVQEIESTGYANDLGASLPLELALRLAPRRRPAGPRPGSRWKSIALVADGTRVRRPPGLKIDSGGLAKGLFADLLADDLRDHASFAVDCAGDLRIGGSAGLPRAVQVADPIGGEILHTFELAEGGIATSGISRRSWLGADGRPAHHVLDPATGRAAFTGILQATAIAPTALEAELRAKAALLSGPDAAESWLVHGGALVFDDGSHRTTEPTSGRPTSGSQHEA
jgi:thiamine biosynthesis lipoprotein